MIEKPAPMSTGTTSGTPQVLLAHHLKQLKLPTVPREYEKVARECARDGVDHPRYLLRLVELELIDRERRMVERRIYLRGLAKKAKPVHIRSAPAITGTKHLKLDRPPLRSRSDTASIVEPLTGRCKPFYIGTARPSTRRS